MNLPSSIEVLNVLLAQTESAAPAGGAAAPPGAGGLLQMMPLLVGFIFIMYFLTIRPQQKKERERQAMLNGIKKGDEVVTTGGICGKVVKASDTDVVLRVDDNVTIKFVRNSIAYVAKAEGDGEK